MDVRTLYDQTHDAAAPDDALGQKRVRLLARQIADAVRDPKMHHSVPIRVARAIVERKLPPSELTEILDSMATKPDSYFKKSRGAYFVYCIQRRFQANEIVW